MNEKEIENNQSETGVEAGFSEYCDQVKQDILKSMSFSELSEEQIDAVVEKAIKGSLSNDKTSKNSMYYFVGVEPWLEANFNQENQESRIVSKQLQQADKLFSASLLANLNKIQRENGKQAANEVAWRTYENYFSFSPNISSYVGDVSNSIELLSIANRGSVAREMLSPNIIGEIIYNEAFSSDKSSLSNLFKNKDPIEQIYLLDTLSSLAERAAGESWSESFANKNRQVLINLTKKPELSPLVKVVALEKIDEIEFSIDSELDVGRQHNYVNYDYDQSAERKKMISQQSNLHKEFPFFESNDYLCLIAPSFCANRVRGRFENLVDSKGDTVAISDWQPNEKITEDDAFLIQVVHNPSVKSKFESELGLELNKIPFETQKYLLRFAAKADNNQYHKLINELNNFEDDGKKMQLVEAFLSTEFGDDFGDDILSIAEHAKPEESLDIFRIVNQYREVSKKFGQIYSGFDKNLALATEKAMNERLSDLLVVAESVAKNGDVTIDVSPRKNNKDYVSNGRYETKINSVNEVIEVMQQFLNSQQLLQEILADTKHTVVSKMVVEHGDVYLGSQTYTFLNEKIGCAQLHTRKRGASRYDASTEFGNADGTEATISWVINPANVLKKPSAKDPDAISVRFDREGRKMDEGAGSIDRSPIRDDGTMSIDISSVLGNDPSKLPVRLGRIIAVGNELRAKRRGVESSLNHNTNYFDQIYGNADNFEKIVKYIENKVESTYERPTMSKLSKIAIGLSTKSEAQDIQKYNIAS